MLYATLELTAHLVILAQEKNKQAYTGIRRKGVFVCCLLTVI